jgi:purine-binding chemotaxis protein CheW
MSASILSPDASVRQYLSFIVAGDRYAIELLKVREILRCETITRVPRMPLAVRGVINLRGNVVPVIDLAIKFGMPASDIVKRSCIVILEVASEGETSVMGILADAVEDVIGLPAEALKPAPLFGTRVRMDFLHGIGQASQGFMLILDIDRVLSLEELHVAAGVQEQEADLIEAQQEAPLSEPPAEMLEAPLDEAPAQDPV